MDIGFRSQQTCRLSQPAISFQSSPRDNKSEMIMMGDLHRINSTGSLNFSGSSGDSLVVDSVPELKHRAGLAADWSVEEQYKLEEALPKFADEPGILRYAKIAATLRNKTVRDVALRCRWMGIKRRKHEELNLWKKTKDKKDKSMESWSKPVLSNSTINVAPFSVSMNHRPRVEGIQVEALQGSIRHQLEQNSQVLGQISTNICALRLQDNVDLFRQMKNNITAILNDMGCMPGPPLPVTLNEVLVNSIISTKSRTMMFPSSSGMNMKQEPGCW
ncbi:hypothetical protein L1987_10844 [Smallanthus sonchifolius]|uniref:Uncharacterized protein n=1 Tax=Smallanthus sonchifolius TaxID=185202 RepID=A0ACB9J9N0_9ASTR|nr:hypothetical protein L1987_10844 [Smallanthus sonchifolius]